DREDLLALDQHVGLGEVADARVHRHHRAAADDVAASIRAGVCRHDRLCARRARREEIEPGERGAGRGCAPEDIAARSEVVLWIASLAQYAHRSRSLIVLSFSMTTLRVS